MLPGASPIRILFLAANPVTTDALKLTQEVRQIEEQLRASRYRDSLQFISRWAVRPDDLQRALLDVEPHIVHFSGHGSEDEGIYLESPEGISAVVDHASLVELLGILKDNIRLVVLNACHTRSLAEAIATHIDCAIGMSSDVGDQAAIEFSAAFYRAIGSGRSVKVAFDLGRSALRLKKIPEDRTPVLYPRAGVDPAEVTLSLPPSGPGDNEPASRPGRAFVNLPPVTPSDTETIWIQAAALSDPVQGTEPSKASPPSELAREDRRARGRWTLAGRLAVALAGVTCVAVAALFWVRARRPPAIEPFPKAAPGVVLSGAWMGTEQGEAFCDALGEALGSEAVRCMAYASPQADDPGVRARARRAGAMVVVLVGDEGAARVYPLGLFKDDPMAGGEFPLEIGRAEARSRTVAMLAALARVARPGQGSAPVEVPCPPIGKGPPDRLTLLVQLFVPSCARETITPQLLEVCDDPASEADCALAWFVYAARCPKCSTAPDALKRLKEEAPPRFQSVAAVQLARIDCEAGRVAEATAALHALAADRSACVKIALAPVAACVLAASRSEQAADPEISALEQIRMDESPECPMALQTDALGLRAYYRARAKRWIEAEADYRAAFHLSQEPLYELSRIEVLLRQRQSGEARGALEAIERFTIADPQHQAYAKLLRWVASRDAGESRVTQDATALVDLYRAVPLQGIAFSGDPDDEDLLTLTCTRSTSAPCAYKILTEPKTSRSTDDLERALASEGPANAESRPGSKGPANVEPRAGSKGPANTGPQAGSERPANTEPRAGSERLASAERLARSDGHAHVVSRPGSVER